MGDRKLPKFRVAHNARGVTARTEARASKRVQAIAAEGRHRIRHGSSIAKLTSVRKLFFLGLLCQRSARKKALLCSFKSGHFPDYPVVAKTIMVPKMAVVKITHSVFVGFVPPRNSFIRFIIIYTPYTVTLSNTVDDYKVFRGVFMVEMCLE